MIISLFFSMAVICGVSAVCEGWGVALVCVKFATLFVYVMLGYSCVGWI